MSKKVGLEAFDELFRSTLDAGGEVIFNVNGTSMRPLIHGGEDEVVLKKPTGSIKKYDIVFYRRKDGTYVLHRLVGRDKKGYIMCGDGQCRLEHGVTEEMIIAIATHIIRGGKRIDLYSDELMKYAKKRVRSIPTRRIVSAVKSRLGR